MGGGKCHRGREVRRNRYSPLHFPQLGFRRRGRREKDRTSVPCSFLMLLFLYALLSSALSTPSPPLPQRYTRTFNVAGAYDFYCEPHSWYMTGTVHVRAVGAAVPEGETEDGTLEDVGLVDQVKYEHHAPGAWGYTYAVRLPHLFWVDPQNDIAHCLSLSRKQCSGCCAVTFKLTTRPANASHPSIICQCSRRTRRRIGDTTSKQSC